MDELAVESSTGRGQLERCEELVDVLEVRSASENLVNNVLNTDDSVLADVLLDHVVVGNRLALLVDIHKSSLVHQLADRLEVGVSIGDVRLNKTEHLEGSLVQANENTIVNLAETEKLENLLGLRLHSIDTTDTDDKGDLGLGLTVEVSTLLGLAAKEHTRSLGRSVLIHVLLGTLEVNLTVGLRLLLESLDASSARCLNGLNALALLQSGLRDGSIHLHCLCFGAILQNKINERENSSKHLINRRKVLQASKVYIMTNKENVMELLQNSPVQQPNPTRPTSASQFSQKMIRSRSRRNRKYIHDNICDPMHKTTRLKR